MGLQTLEANAVDYVYGLARNARLEARIADALSEAQLLSQANGGQPARVFRDFDWDHVDSCPLNVAEQSLQRSTTDDSHDEKGSPPRRRRASGWGASFRLAIGSRTGSAARSSGRARDSYEDHQSRSRSRSKSTRFADAAVRHPQPNCGRSDWRGSPQGAISAYSRLRQTQLAWTRQPTFLRCTSSKDRLREADCHGFGAIRIRTRLVAMRSLNSCRTALTLRRGEFRHWSVRDRGRPRRSHTWRAAGRRRVAAPQPARLPGNRRASSAR
jgi:hypothetical protein